MNPIFRKYKERFIQISGRNRSLYLKNIVKKYSYDVGTIIENTGGMDTFMEFLWHYKRTYKLIDEKIISKYVSRTCAASDEAITAKAKDVSESSKEVEIPRLVEIPKPKKSIDSEAFLQRELNSLKYLKREVEDFEKETGRYELYVGYPFVFGNLAQDMPIKAPLLLIPCTLNLDKDEAELALVPGQPIMLNKALILAYSKEHNVRTDSIIQEFDPLAEDTFTGPSDVLDYLNKKGFKFKFSRKKSITAFSETDDFPEEGLEVKNMAVLGKFPLANSIYNDYLALEKDNLTSPSIEALLSTKQGEKLTPKEKRVRKQIKFLSFFRKKQAKVAKAPLFYEINDLDYAQENALAEIAKQDNIVIYGPPGTGKSQTIVNIISDALCKKKRVLVVSQKRAALDVVFNRLGKLNDKAMLIPDPEKDKTAFFDRVKNMHALASSRNYDESFLKHQKVALDIDDEINILKQISSTLFTKTDFGITLQEMYAGSTNIGKDDKDYALYEKLKSSPIIEKNYAELSDSLKLIKDKNLVKLFITRLDMIKQNEMVKHILPDIDMHTLKSTQAFISDILSRDILPFNMSENPYARYLMTFYLEEAVPNRRSVARVADIITRIQHPQLSKWLQISAIPPMWLAYPALQIKFNSYKEDVKIDLNITKHNMEKFEEDYKIFANVLDSEGYALTIGSLLNGNKDFLRKLLSALENYIAIRDMNSAISDVNSEVKEILEFAYANASTGDIECTTAVVDKILPIRIYHEIIKNDANIEKFLSKTVTFNDLRSRILSLKADQRELSKRLAVDIFAKEYADYFKAHPNKDFIYEIGKQRGLKPIRVMMDYFEDYLLTLFPCWLCSPEVVSTILPLKPGMFDLVVFDEASQIFIESAIPSIYRGAKVVVAGDNKQLRPASTFVKRITGDDMYEETYDLATQAALEVESLLDLATSRFFPVYLSYHYRSHFAELIDFSNAAFYDNKLQVAPNITRNNENPPIERIKVKGIWENRHNREEALAILKLVKSIFRDRENNESIGIVTFNLEQKEFIEDVFDEEANSNRSFAKQLMSEKNRINDGENTSIFVKNLENVQGDERDIIIFSVGYAKNNEDRVVAQFGSLSMEGGENRLNVAITRAKKKVYVVTSIEPEELDKGETYKNPGAKLLRKYLQYARAVSSGSDGEITNILKSLRPTAPVTTELGAYESQIKEALESMGYEVDINLGNTNYKLSLGVFDKDLNRYVLGIECDYRAFHSSESVLERDVYRFKFLGSKGWKIMRVWSRDWWLSRNKVLDSIVAEIENEKYRLQRQRESDL